VSDWIEMIRGLGLALIEVLRAEAAALAGDLKRSGRDLAIGVVLLAAAAGIGFWLLGLLIASIVAVIAIWLPVWAAALITVGLFLTVAGILAALGARRLKKLESPVRSVSRRVEDHVNWWQARLLPETEPTPTPLSAGPPQNPGVEPPSGGVL
jgi:hypothetical protein